ncbi:sulfatase [Halopiger xanaduensis]|uniref:Sulfatase n=1 Tax=Halopiger xanaduensis (strain DSM 18323 / JCM 14033 / SH-6) TaxID=797210 RepID=F8DAN9_HALXS|nr:sulfatase [Halopiger xanaduensis]AEH36981.1 sulfatase [Halopiger xanaduensis SH-6]
MKPNVLLIVLDSVRARNTSLHEHANDTTPFLNEFAESATRYRQARAPGTTSVTSHASIFTGLHVNEHRVTSAEAKLSEGATVFERLRDEHGYETGVFSENVWITDVDIGLDHGFDTVVGPQDVPYPDALNPRSFVSDRGTGRFTEYVRECLRDDAPLRGLINGAYTKISSDYPSLLPSFIDGTSPGNLYTDKFLDWIDTTVNDEWAACVNLMDAHLPYNPKEEFNEWGDDLLRTIEDEAVDQWQLHCGDGLWWRQKAREALYDGAIRQADSYVQRIIDGLEERGVLDDTLVVITSDHGEGFGERSRIRPARIAGHNVSVHEVLLHVPLVVKRPGQRNAHEVDSVATLARFPTVVENALEGATAPDGFVPDRPVVASSYRITDDESLKARALEHCDDLSAFESFTHVVYEDDDDVVRKYITWKDREATVEIRNAQDSYKVSNTGGRKVREVFGEMEEAAVRAEGSGTDDLDEATYDRLEKLGYV